MVRTLAKLHSVLKAEGNVIEIIFGFTIFICIFYAAVKATITNEKLKNFVTTFYYNSSDRRGSGKREAAAVFSLSLVQFCFCIFIICIAARTQPVPAPFLCLCIVLYFEQRQSFFFRFHVAFFKKSFQHCVA